MARKIIPCSVSNEYVLGAGAIVGAAGSGNDVALQLTFNEMWAGLTKHITWYDAKGENPTVSVLTLDMLAPGETMVYIVPIPPAPKAFEGLMQANIEGCQLSGDGSEVESSTVATTAYFRILPANCSLAEDGSITPTISQQMQAQLDGLTDEIKAIPDSIIRAGESADSAAVAAAAAAASADRAQTSAASAADSAAQAGNQSLYSEAQAIHAKSWAVGETGIRAGEDTNNAKYWSEQARFAAQGGVISFNGRSGAVTPQAGDYTAAMVGAAPAAHASRHATGGDDALTPADIGAAGKSTVVSATLAASGWANGVYTLTMNGVTTTSNQEILPALNITAEQLEALQAANIQDGGQAANTITLKAYGDTPTMDIPIRVIVRGDA